MGSKSATEMIEFPCPECSTRLKVGASLAGHPVKCPSCGYVALAPTGEDQQPPEASAVVANPPPDLSPEGEQIAAEVAPEDVKDTAQSTESSGPEIGADTPARQLCRKISAEVAKVFVGQDELVQGTLVALFSGGHVMIESVPGLGKTLFVRTLGKILGCDSVSYTHLTLPTIRSV